MKAKHCLNWLWTYSSQSEDSLMVVRGWRNIKQPLPRLCKSPRGSENSHFHKNFKHFHNWLKLLFYVRDRQLCMHMNVVDYKTRIILCNLQSLSTMGRLAFRQWTVLFILSFPFLHGQKGLGSRLAGDTDKRFVYFVSSQNIRPSSFIPMGKTD